MLESGRQFNRETPPPLPSKEKLQWQDGLKEKIKRMEDEKNRLLDLGLDPKSISFGTLIERIARLKAELATGRTASVDVDMDDIDDQAEEVEPADIIQIDDDKQ